MLRHALPTDLRLSGTGAVLVETIRPLLHDREPDTIDALRPTVLAVLPITEPKPSVKVQHRVRARGFFLAGEAFGHNPRATRT